MLLGERLRLGAIAGDHGDEPGIFRRMGEGRKDGASRDVPESDHGVADLL
jgi:hypothetical protein